MLVSMSLIFELVFFSCWVNIDEMRFLVSCVLVVVAEASEGWCYRSLFFHDQSVCLFMVGCQVTEIL